MSEEPSYFEFIQVLNFIGFQEYSRYWVSSDRHHVLLSYDVQTVSMYTQTYAHKDQCSRYTHSKEEIYISICAMLLSLSSGMETFIHSTIQNLQPRNRVGFVKGHRES